MGMTGGSARPCADCLLENCAKGFGGGVDDAVLRTSDIIPHNSLLGLWAFCGMLGFFGLMLGATVSVFLALRAYRFAGAPADRAAALVCACAVLIWILQAWGDMGTTSWHGALVMGAALAVAGRLAVRTGAWPQGKTGEAVAC